MAAKRTDAPIRIEADVTGYEAAIQDIASSTQRFGEVFSASMRSAAIAGTDFDDTLRSISLRISQMALGKAFQPLDNLVGDLLAGAVGGLAGGGNSPAAPAATGRNSNITFNVASPDAAGFKKSETQIASLLARAVARGNRGL